MYFVVQDSCKPIFGHPEQYQVTINLFQLSNCNLWQSCTSVRRVESIKKAQIIDLYEFYNVFSGQHFCSSR